MGFSLTALAVLRCGKSWLFSGVPMPSSQLASHSVLLISHLLSAMHTTAAAVFTWNRLASYNPALVRHVL